MDRRQRGALGRIGMPAVAASALSVAFVVAAAVTDRVALLAVSAAVAAIAVALLINRQSSGGRATAPTFEPPPTGEDHPTQAPGIEPQLADDAERYQAEALTARADLLVTLRQEPSADSGHPTGAGPSSHAEDESSPGTGPGAPPQASSSSSTPGIPAGPSPSAPSDPESDRDPLLDPVTGLFTQSFFETSLSKRVPAARRGLRPLSVAAVTVVVGRPGDGATPANPTVVAQAMTEVFREADTLAVADDGLFLILLEDTPEAGAVWTLERLRRHLTAQDAGHTMRAGVSCYPAHSFDAQGLISQARSALDGARRWQQDRIEIAPQAID